jgi:hypothetical protein
MILRLWLKIHEPRVRRLIFLFIYLMTLVAGVSALVVPPAALEGTVVSPLAYVWATLLVISGMFGAWGVLPGLWWAEHIAAYAGVPGSLIYAFLIFQAHTSEFENRIPQVCAVLIVGAAFCSRWYETRGINYEPRPDRA